MTRRAVNTGCRYFGMKTKWTCRTKTQCLPVRMSSASAYVIVLGHAGCVQIRYNYRLDPWPRHRVAFGKAFGCARVVFNEGLRARQEAHEAGRPYITDAELSTRLTAAKKTPERQWLGGVSAVVLQQALADLNAAKNVLALGRRESLNACQGGVRPGGTLAAAGETGSLRGAA